MTISSSFTLGTVEVDGRRYVTERHVDDFGIVYSFEYLAAASASYSGIMTARATALPGVLSAAEVARDLDSILSFGDSATVTLSYCAAVDVRNAVRTQYKGSTQIQAVAIGAFLSTLTDNQLKTAFGLTDSQTAILRTKVTSAVGIWHEVQAESGQ